MEMKFMKWLLAAGVCLLAACAFITINVYFPEKAAKEAYKSLDEMLLKNPVPGTGNPPAREPAPTAPQSRQFKLLPALSLVSAAYAADKEGDELAVEMASMPEVNKAYEEMSQRLPRLNGLFDSGVVGLTNQGLISVRDKARITAQDEALVSAENQSRKIVVGAMAKAIFKITKQEQTKKALDQVLSKAAATYADNKREAASKGWWVQSQNGRWLQK
ncbi:MAG TPA: DUF1318 domain-containing protein [Desulfuromonadaceae bacterium]|jgi:hypothetical protein